jgi:signal transduction histidine kinase
VIGYGIVASAWIISTDLLANTYASEAFLKVEVFKGWFFVLVTAVFLKFLIDRHIRRIRKSERRLHSVIDCMADGVLLVDRDGYIVRANQAALALFGLLDAKPLLNPFRNLARDFDIRTPDGTPVPGEGHVIARALGGETIQLTEITLQRRDGNRVTLAASVAPVHDGTGHEITLAVALLRDVTEVKRLERLRDEFLSMAAHELKTPVTTLKAYVQILRRFPERGSVEQGDVLGVLDRQCNRLSGLVQELLDVARLQLGSLALRTKTFDLADVAEQVAGSLRSVLPDHRIAVDVEHGSIVTADAERIQQVLNNLIDNAAKFSPTGTDIIVRVHRRGSEIETSVTDAGIGIAADKQGLLFHRFTQLHTGTEHDKGGLGLGLFISREIVLRHDGQIWVESTPGKGSIFHFTIPCASRHAAAGAV